MANGDNQNVTLVKIRQGTAYFQYDTTTVSNEIKAVQKALQLMGYNPGGNPDGKYGPGTRAAVRGFQNENDITPIDGCIRQATLLSIEDWSGTLYATPPNPPTLDQVRKGLDSFNIGDSGNAVNALRSRLINKGYSCSSTGTYDTTLAGIITLFQSNVGLSADGIAGQATLAALEDTVSDTGWLSGGIILAQLSRQKSKIFIMN